MLAAMEQLRLLPKVSKPCPVLVTYFDREYRHEYLQLAANLRAGGIGTELYPELKKLGAQLKYADAQGFAIAVIAGGDEWGEGRCKVKQLATKETFDIPYRHGSPRRLVEKLRELLGITRR